MAVNGRSPDSAVGTVEAVNERGFKIDGVWANWSKWAENAVMPERGQTVRVTFDKGGFVRSCTAVDGSAVTPAPTTAHNVTSDERQRTITRLAVLKAAAEFAASRSQVKSADVLVIAESWERWVLRDDDADATEELP